MDRSGGETLRARYADGNWERGEVHERSMKVAKRQDCLQQERSVRVVQLLGALPHLPWT